MSRNVGIIMIIAEQSSKASDFWNRIAFKYAKAPLQLGFETAQKQRKKP